MKTRGWCGGLWSVLVFTVGCGSESGAGSPGVGGGGTTSDAGRGGEASAGKAGSDPSAAGGGGSGGASNVGGSAGQGGTAQTDAGLEGELVAELDCDELWSTVVLDDESIFYTCVVPPGEFSTKPSFELRELVGSEAKVLATSETPLDMLAQDETGYFVRQYGTYSSTGSGATNGHVRRLALDGTELVPFKTSSNEDAFVLGQSTDMVAIAEHTTQLGTGAASFHIDLRKKADAAGQQIANGKGLITTSWVEGTGVGWVAGGTDGAPFAYFAPFMAGDVTVTETELPDLCRKFVRDGDGFWAACGKEGELLDVVHLDAQLATTPLARAVIQSSLDRLYASDRVYWAHAEYGAEAFDEIGAVDELGKVSTRAVAKDLEIVTLTAEYAYIRTKSGRTEPRALRRISLSDI